MSDKVILITGCSSGIGYYCAQQLAQRGGWQVFATVRQDADRQRLNAERLTPLLLDLDSADSIRNAVTQVLEQSGGRIDALFNNGAYGQPGAVEDLPVAALRAQLETNVIGTQALTNAVLPIMRRQKSGRIIQNSSVLGFVSMRYRGAYNASKYALEGLSDTMRLELHGSGIHVILIEPGPITSDFRKNANKKFRRYFDDAAIGASAHCDYYRQHLLSDDAIPVPPFNLEPDAVYQALLKALESPRPRARYGVTLPTHVFWWARRLLPTRWLDAVLRRI